MFIWVWIDGLGKSGNSSLYVWMCVCVWREWKMDWLRANEQSEPDLIESNCIPFSSRLQLERRWTIDTFSRPMQTTANRSTNGLQFLLWIRFVRIKWNVCTFIDFCDKNECRHGKMSAASTFYCLAEVKKNTWTHVSPIHHLSSNSQNQRWNVDFFSSVDVRCRCVLCHCSPDISIANEMSNIIYTSFYRSSDASAKRWEGVSHGMAFSQCWKLISSV